MRLFLSSYRAGNHDRRLVELFGKGTEVAVVTNAKDYKTPEERQASVDEIFDYLAGIAMKPVEIDLRNSFGKPEITEKTLRKYSAIWMAGGNTFILRKALKYSGADRFLYDAVRKNETVYGGESAGAILATPTLTGVEFGDDPTLIPVGYSDEIIREGLGFTSYHIIPHYQSEWEGADAMAAALQAANLEYRTMTDAQAIIIDGDKEEFLG
jgi:dipeptidase E